MESIVVVGSISALGILQMNIFPVSCEADHSLPPTDKESVTFTLIRMLC